MPRKQSYSAEEVADAITAAKGLQTKAADILGCTRQTVANYIDRYATVKAAYDSANDAQLDITEGALFDQIDSGNITAIIFYLKTKGKGRGYVERQEHTGSDGKSIKFELVYPE